MRTDEDLLERHADLVAGVGAVAWAVAGWTIAPQLVDLCAPVFACGFGLTAVGRWYRKLRARKEVAPS